MAINRLLQIKENINKIFEVLKDCNDYEKAIVLTNGNKNCSQMSISLLLFNVARD